MLKNKFFRWFLPWVCGLVFLLGSCSSETTQASAPSPSNPAFNTSSVPGAQSPTIQTDLPRLRGKATVVMQVNGQEITIVVDGTKAPITAGNFVDLVNRGVYNGTVFHRVVRKPQPFVVQGGDPQSKNSGIPAELLGTGSFIDPLTNRPRYIPLEIEPEGQALPIYGQTLSAAKVTTPPKLKHSRGAVAMARSQLPDSASAQFYFALSELPPLDGDYAVFGYVTDGMAVVDQIQQGDRLTSAKVTQGLENLQKSG